MLIKIGGDTLALDKDIRRQIESQAAQLAARFPGEDIEARAVIQEEFDPIHGHRVRCELGAKLARGRQIVVRDARKTAPEAISAAFATARRNLRSIRGQARSGRSTVAPRIIPGAEAVGG